MGVEIFRAVGRRWFDGAGWGSLVWRLGGGLRRGACWVHCLAGSGWRGLLDGAGWGGGFWLGGWAGVCRVFAGCPLCCSAVRRGAIRRGWGGVLLGCRVSGDKRRGGVCQIFPGVLRPQFERVAAGWALRFLGRLGGGGLMERAGVLWFGGWAVGCGGGPVGFIVWRGRGGGGCLTSGRGWGPGLSYGRKPTGWRRGLLDGAGGGGGFWFGGWAGVCLGFVGCSLCCSVVRRGRSVGAGAGWRTGAGVVAGVGGGVLLGCWVSGDKRRGGVCQNFPGVLRPQFERVAPGWTLRFLGRLGGGGLAERAGVLWFGGWVGVCGGGLLGSLFGGVVVAGVA